MVDGDLEVGLWFVPHFARVAADHRERCLHVFRRLKGGHPAVAKPRHPPITLLDVPSLIQVGVGGDPDRNRLLNRTRQHSEVAEAPILSIVIDVLAGRGEPQYLDRLLHAAHPAGGLDPEMGKLLLQGTSARPGLALTGYENSAPAGEEIETSPLVGKHQRIAQRGAGEARRSDAHASGAGGDRSHQYHCVKPGFGENRVANPHRIPAKRLGIRRQLQHLRHGGRADDDATIGKSEPEFHPASSHLFSPSPCWRLRLRYYGSALRSSNVRDAPELSR